MLAGKFPGGTLDFMAVNVLYLTVILQCNWVVKSCMMLLKFNVI